MNKDFFFIFHVKTNIYDKKYISLEHKKYKLKKKIIKNIDQRHICFQYIITLFVRNAAILTRL